MKMSALTTQQFLVHLCDYSHPLASIFITEWISRGCKDVIENKEELLKEEIGKRSIISPEAWVECAEVLKKALEDRQQSK